MSWYVLQVYSGFEDKTSEAIKELATKLSVEKNIKEILIPTHDVLRSSYGKKVVIKKKFLPGYILINMDMAEDFLHLIKTLPKVSGFIGASKDGLPYPVSEAEINKLLNSTVDQNSNNVNMEPMFDVGEQVNIISGPFNRFKGVIEEVEEDKRKIKVAVSIFGRLTPVELEYHQVEKLDT
ncbi:Transcription termination/antitermination protein NusG [Candidatus Hepatincolaceae symbiont of Richtersius coronifer]